MPALRALHDVDGRSACHAKFSVYRALKKLSAERDDIVLSNGARQSPSIRARRRQRQYRRGLAD